MAKELNDMSILIVDDTSEARKLMKLVLSGLGVHQIFTANDGRMAQDLLGAAEGMIDLVICDWRMPRMTGLELLQQIRSVYPDMPFIMVTGNADLESIKAARQFDVSAYIKKPYSPQQVEKKLIALAQTL